MPKKSEEELGRELQKCLEKRSNWWEVLQRHPDFIHFCKTRFPETRLDKIRWDEIMIPLGVVLPLPLAINLYDIIVPLPLQICPEDQILMSFLETRKGEALAREYGLYPLEESAVQVVPHQRARDIIDRNRRPWAINPEEISRAVMEDLRTGLDQDFDKIGLTPLANPRDYKGRLALRLRNGRFLHLKIEWLRIEVNWPS